MLGSRQVHGPDHLAVRRRTTVGLLLESATQSYVCWSVMGLGGGDRRATTESVSSVSHIGHSGNSSGDGSLAERTLGKEFWRRVTRGNETYFSLGRRLQCIISVYHILVHMTSTREVNERGRKSLREALCRKGRIRWPESVSGVRPIGRRGVENSRWVFEIYVLAANTVQHTVSRDIVTANDVRIPFLGG